MTSPRAFPAHPSPQPDPYAAFRRAVAEGLQATPTGDPGAWECGGYTIVEIGPRPIDVLCCCPDARFRRHICKHAVGVVAARRRGPIETRMCRTCGINPVWDGFTRCAACEIARP